MDATENCHLIRHELPNNSPKNLPFNSPIHIHENGIKFVFKYDEQAPELLHIYARHLTTIDNALDLFFDEKPVWSEQFERYENYSDKHGLYWYWINQQNKIVMIISCFRK